MFKGASVAKRNLGGKDGGLEGEGKGSIEEKDGFQRRGIQTQVSKRKKKQ